jgi:hypothetical protein
MRFQSGVTDQYIYFVAVDSTDLKTRETGLSSFTVYRARNVASTPTAFTTPTVTEVSSANMPGVYSLLLDEDMTIGSGNDSEAVVLHITQASMAPVTLTYELYRPVVTAGETVGVSSGAVSNVTTTATATAVTTVNGLASGVITATSIAADAIGASELAADAATEIATAVWATATRSLTILDEDSTTLDLDATIRAAVGLASANLDTQIGDLPTNAELATSQAAADDATLAAIAALNNPSAAAIADAVWDEAIAGHVGAGSTGEALSDAGSAGDPWSTALPGAYGSGTAGKIIGDNINATISSRATQTSVDTIDDLLDTEIGALTTAVADLPTNAELATALGTADDATLSAIAAVDTKIDTLTTNVGTVDTVLDALVADIGSNGSGLTAIPWNSSWDVEVESEVTDALTTYDVATVADVGGGGGGGGATADEIADEVQSRILNVNIVQVNEIPINGDGTDEDAWGPVG